MTARTEQLKLDTPLAGDLLAKALPQVERAPLVDFPVRGVTCDSREVKAGYLFVAVPGTSVDGAAFARQAASNGAALVVTYRRINDLRCPQIVVADSRQAAARLAAAFYGLDELSKRGVKLVGITGTNGKTTVSYIFQHFCASEGIACARLGTVDYDIVGEKVAARETTPGPLELCRLVRQALDHGAKMVVMEVSSHALSQARADGLNFASAVFTNLSGDHLDYHETMEKYLDAKLQLFRGLGRSAWAVVNLDDPCAGRVIASAGGQIVTYGIELPEAMLRADVTALSSRQSCFDVALDGKITSARSPYIGKHNVYNALAAIGAAVSVGLPVDACLQSLPALSPVPGRLERVPCEAGFEVFVDYAHTDDALRNVLASLKPVTEGRLIVVFGCGGDRDRTKRPRMAAAAERWADRVWVTSDNPRTEDPAFIIGEIIKGFSQKGLGKVAIEADRASAIRQALGQARRGDVVLIAGKGHEPYQIVGTQRFPFDDRQQARLALGELGLLTKR